MDTYVYGEKPKRRSSRSSLLVLGLLLGVCGGFLLKPEALPGYLPTKTPRVESTSQTGTVGPQTAIWTVEDVGATIAELLAYTNRQRTNNLTPVLKLNESLNQSALRKCQDMATKDYWSHTDPAGQEPWHFMSEAGYPGIKLGENLGFGFASSEAVVKGWIASPTHKATMLDSAFSDVGFGVCNSPDYLNSGPQTIVVQHFGKPLP